MLRRVASAAIQRRAGLMSVTTATNPNPPPNAARGATADLCDVFVPEPVDKITDRAVQIAEPIFRFVDLPSPAAFHALPFHA
jgi:hypothetical protein